MSLINGFGTTHFGRSAYVPHDQTEEEEFDTTLWVCAFWIPIFPLKSYRIRQKFWYHRKELKFDAPGGIFSASQASFYSIVKSKKMDLKQVAWTYGKLFIGITVLLLLAIFIHRIPNPEKIYSERLRSQSHPSHSS